MSASEKTNDEPGSELETIKAEGRAGQIPDEWQPVPLFLRDTSDGRKGNAQDEKDDIGE